MDNSRAVEKLPLDDTANSDHKLDHSICSWRSMIVLMCCFAISLHLAMDNVLNVSSVCMIKRTTKNITRVAEINATSFSFTINNKSKCQLTSKQEQQYNGNLAWSQKQIDYVLAAKGWGRIISIFPAGLIADRYSAGHILFFALLICSLRVMTFPAVATWLGVWPSMALRFVQGITSGIKQPCLLAIISQWLPKKELSSRLIFVLSSQQLCHAFLGPLVAQCCMFKQIWGGWPISFFTSGLSGLVWCLIWQIYATTYPEQHSKISKCELAYILYNRGFKMEDKTKIKSFRDYPFCAVLCSKASLACMVNCIAGSFGSLCVSIYFPRYLRDVVILDLGLNGFISGLPSLAQYVSKLGCSRIADWMKNGLLINRSYVVKGFNTIGMCSLAVFLILATFATCEQPMLAIGLIILSKTFFAACSPGHVSSAMLIAPRYAGLLCGWFHMAATSSQIILPYLVSIIIVDSQNVAQWRIVFGIGTIMQLFAALIFLMWGSGEEQEWAKSKVANVNREEELQFCGDDRPKITVQNT